MLPHELVHTLYSHADPEVLMSVEGMNPGSQAHLQSAKTELGVADLLGLAVWGDGVPCNFDRTESLECFCLSLPGLPAAFKTFRVPLAAITKKFVIKGDTFDDILSIVQWSLEACALGVFPARRHDGAVFQRSDKQRAKQALKPLGCSAELVEVRGDWQFYKTCFGLPGWRENAGCCWRCRARSLAVAVAVAVAVVV